MILNEETLKEQIANIIIYKREIEAMFAEYNQCQGETKEAYEMVIRDKIWKMENHIRDMTSIIFVFCTEARMELGNYP
jgi:hypothetical protein